jgi:hypothetical protein
MTAEILTQRRRGREDAERRKYGNHGIYNDIEMKIFYLPGRNYNSAPPENEKLK